MSDSWEIPINEKISDFRQTMTVKTESQAELDCAVNLLTQRLLGLMERQKINVWGQGPRVHIREQFDTQVIEVRQTGYRHE